MAGGRPAEGDPQRTVLPSSGGRAPVLRATRVPARGGRGFRPEEASTIKRVGDRSSSVQSVERALDILETLAAANRAMGISELGEATDLPYATIHRIAATLLARGYLRQESRSRKYVLGPRVLRLGASLRAGIGAVLQPHLSRLAELTGETANFAVLDGGQVVYVAQAPSRHMLRTFTEVGNRVLPHATAVGKAMLAHEDRAVVERIIERYGLPARTANSITDPAALFTELDRVAAAGYALDDEEQELGVRCLGVPVLVSGEVVGALSISGPAERLGGDRRSALLPHLQHVAAEAALQLGHGDPDDAFEHQRAGA